MPATWPRCRRRAASSATTSSRCATSEVVAPPRPRWAALLAGLWGGELLTLALVATPSLFALIERAQAGRIAGRMLAVEARVALALAVVFFLVERRHARQTGRALSAEQLLVLGALFCTVAGYFALQPMMEAARAGQGAWSFGALHAVSVGFYAFKTGLVLLLAWRLAAR